MTTEALALVPTWRLGTLLAEARTRQGLSLDELGDVAAGQAAGGNIALAGLDLAAVERGDVALADHQLEAIVALYGLDPDATVPERTDLVVDLDQHRLATAGHTQALAGPAPTADEVLASYLSLVYTLRRAEPGSRVPLRQADLDVLARALALATPDVEHRLVDLMVAPSELVRERTRWLRARVLVPAAGVLVALTVGGALVVSSRSDDPIPSTPAAVESPAPAAPASSTPASSVQVGGAATETRNPDGSSGPVVVAGDPLNGADVPPGGVGVGDPQVAVRNPDGSVTQTSR